MMNATYSHEQKQIPTPPEIVAHMVELADLKPDHRVLVPNAGGAEDIIQAIGDQPDKVAVESNHDLVVSLLQCGISGLYIYENDFLDSTVNLGEFDRIIMKPPLARAADIKHIKHALTLLKPGGRLVALCANGPGEQKEFRSIADYWQSLSPGTLKDAGTNAALLLLIKQA